ncbi:MAG: M42 family metallopeptidase [Candidatus Sumerlaeaceae bacterium]|nr:M42 family metallopeptidase [Candidatus Sumerlaeaceae bacterium]
MESMELLKKLSEAHGPSGYEDEVREIIREVVSPFADEVKGDALGNLMVWRHASRKDAPVLLIDAHMDEVGFVVSHVETSGFLRLAPIGGWDERVLPGMCLQVCTRERKKIVGVIGTTPPHIQSSDEKRNPLTLEQLFLDVGCGSRDEVFALGIRIGDSVVPAESFKTLSSNVVSGKAFDDRIGCALLVELMTFLADQPRLGVEVVALFSTFEELNARGAMVGAFTVNPAAALVLEATVAADVPSVPETRCPTRLGEGPALTLMDKYTHCHPRLVRALEATAQQNNLPYQFKRPIFGGTNAARIQTTRAGVATAIVSVPCRYIHSPSSIMRIADYEHTKQLVTAFVLDAEQWIRGEE